MQPVAGAPGPPLPQAPTHALAFAEMVALHPRCPAVIEDGEPLSYAQLGRRATVLARWIDERCGTHSRPVALLSPNAPAAAVGLLGILGAARPALLLDPANPPARLAQMLALADPGGLISDPSLATPGRQLAGAAGIAFRVIQGDAADGPYPVVAATPQQTAAIVFTSGSSGQPKGCAESESDSLERCRIYGDLIGLGPGQVVGVVHHHGGSRMQPNSALLRGAAVAYYDFARLGLAPLPDWMMANGVDSMRLFPTTFRHLCEGLGAAGRLPTLRTLVLTGEPVHGSDVAWLRRLAPAARCLSVYSSTETGPMAAVVIEPDDPLPKGPLPLGTALPGKRLFVVDGEGQPLPEGEVGEVVLESRDVFQGYLDDGANRHGRLTHTADGARRYRTGDHAYVNRTGALVSAGRRDGLVKVRGHRIELAEVESALLRCQGVTHAAAVTFERAPGMLSLAAYVVLAGSTTVPVHALREQLAESLPGAMLPSRFVVLDAPPLGTTGKLTRSALPPLARDRGRAGQFRDPTQAALATIWSDVLDTLALQPDTDFFDAGGDSLMAATVALEVEALFGVRLPLTVFGERRTLAALADLIDAPQVRHVAPTVVPLRRRGSCAPVFAIAGTHGHVLRFVQVAQDLSAAVPLFGLQPPGLAWTGIDTIEAMAAHYVAAMRGQQRQGPYRLIGASFGGVLAFEIACQLESAGERLEWLCLLDTHRPGVPAEHALQAGQTPDSDAVDLVRVHRLAQARYATTARLVAPLHQVVAVEYPLQPSDTRDWRRHFEHPPRCYPVTGLHGAFHAPPQRAPVMDLLNRLATGVALPPAQSAAALFDRPAPPLAACGVSGARGIVDGMERHPHHLRLRGSLVLPAPGCARPRVALYQASQFLGWSPLLRRDTGNTWRFDFKLPPAQVSGTLLLQVLDDQDRAVLDLPVEV